MVPLRAQLFLWDKLSLHLTGLGGTLEHLGVQMYKKPEPAIAEIGCKLLGCNAHTVNIFVPEKEEYEMLSRSITICDGIGMSPEQIQNEYLVVGWNRRRSGHESVPRSVMGRNGIGNLAGFGIANVMEITTWQKASAARFLLDIAKLTTDDDKAKQYPLGKGVSQSDA